MAETSRPFDVNPVGTMMAQLARAFDVRSSKDSATFWSFGLQQVQAGLKAQADLLDRFHSTTETCLLHRRQNIEDAFTAVGRMSECKDVGEVLAIQQKWLSAYTQSLMEEFAALAGATTTTRSTAKQDRPAARDQGRQAVLKSFA